ncbi:MAG: carboxylesterase [Paraburkholderia sp.]|nr:carboxylesterase [Paraburkholderia sp.]
MKARNSLTTDICYAGNDHAVLLLHGLRSTPQEMGYIARRLNESGFGVFAPYIEGYGLGSPCTSRKEWLAEARMHYSKLRQRYRTVSVAGLCIGATPELALAAQGPGVAGLSLLSVTQFYDGWTIPWYQCLLNLSYRTPLRHFYSFSEREPYGLKYKALRPKVAGSMRQKGDSEIGASTLSMRHIYEAQALAQHVKERLPHIKANCLLIHAIDDDTSTVANAEFVHDRIGSTVKRKIFLDDCYHIISMDNERELVARETRWFFEEALSTPLRG